VEVRFWNPPKRTQTGYVCRLPVVGTLRMKMIQVLFENMGHWLANERDEFGSKVLFITVQDGMFANRRAL
jgi:hypothetical protein